MTYRTFSLILSWVMYFLAFFAALLKEYPYAGFAMATACFWAIQVQGRD